jgi:hypothetical protein
MRGGMGPRRQEGQKNVFGPTLLLTIGLLAAILAGCIGAEEDSAPEAQAASLERAPQWSIGQWWTMETHDSLTDTVSEVTLVVTESGDTTARIGMTAETFNHRFFVYHLPPLGDIRLESFSWNVMGHEFDALEFPLHKGNEWETVFHGIDYGWNVKAEVMETDGHEAHIHMIGDNVLIDVVYDAELGMITQFDSGAYGVSFKMTDHGYDYEGDVRTPSNIDLGFLEGRVGTVLDAAANPGSPILTVEQTKEVTHGTLAFIVGGLPQLGTTGPGTYHATATTPTGTTYERTFTPTPMDGVFLMELEGIEGVHGDWELTFTSAGAAWLAVELIVYDLEETTLGPAI